MLFLVHFLQPHVRSPSSCNRRLVFTAWKVWWLQFSSLVEVFHRFLAWKTRHLSQKNILQGVSSGETSWWLNQPMWKICSSNLGIYESSPIFGVNINNIWNYHLGNVRRKKPLPFFGLCRSTCGSCSRAFLWGSMLLILADFYLVLCVNHTKMVKDLRYLRKHATSTLHKSLIHHIPNILNQDC